MFSMEQSIKTPTLSLKTRMKEFQEYHRSSLGADPDETLEEFLIRKGDTALLGYLRAIQAS